MSQPLTTTTTTTKPSQSTNRLNRAMAQAQQANRPALITYLCAGDPSMESTTQLLLAAAQGGADIVEVGVPFSDPTADGPVIQRASERALAHGASLPGVLQAVRRLREHSDVAVLLFGYLNPILAYGEERLVRDAAEAGVDGLLIVDLPADAAGPLVQLLRAQKLAFVPLVAPTTPDARVARIASLADAFIYFVSLTGVTGAKAANLEQAAARAAAVRQLAGGTPVAIGFGIRTAEQAAQVGQSADAVVVGSALCEAVAAAPDPEQAAAAVRAKVSDLAAAMAHSRTAH